MEIVDRVNQKQNEVITTYRYMPKHAYLGASEFKELIDWAMEEYDYGTEPSSTDGIELLGLKVFEVKAENHLNVA